MKFLAVVCLLIAAVAFVTAQQQHCWDKQFSAVIGLVDPTQHYDDVHKLWYDADGQQQRLEIHEFEPADKHLTVLLKHKEGKMYVLDQSTNECTSHPLEGPLPPFCLANNATKVDTVTVGGSLKVDAYVEKFRGFTTRIMVAQQNNIPVNIFTKGGSFGSIFEEWTDFQHGISNMNVFDIPNQCKNAKRSMVPVRPQLLQHIKRLNTPIFRTN
ncbi:hypothetical protein ABK040_015619 [Willaertia magna]